MFYQLEEARRIDQLRSELDDFDRAVLSAYAMNAPKELETRRRALLARLRDDPSTPAQPKFTKEEMSAAAQRLMASVLSTGKLPS